MLKKILSLQIGRVLYGVYKLDTDLKQIGDHPKISYVNSDTILKIVR